MQTEKSYQNWIRRCILFHHQRHPSDIGKPEIEAFLLTDLATNGVAPATQNQAFNALMFCTTKTLDIFHAKSNYSGYESKPKEKNSHWFFYWTTSSAEH